MDKPLEPVHITIRHTSVQPARRANWDIDEGKKWEYKRPSDVTGHDKLLIFNIANKRREFELDERSDLVCRVVEGDQIQVVGNVFDYTKVPF